MLAIGTTTLKRYFMKMKDETEYISLSCPFSFKNVPRNINDYVYENDLTVGLSLYVKLTDNVEEGIIQSKKIMNDMKYSFVPMASFILMSLYRMFASTETNAKQLVGAGKRHTMLWSNIPGYMKTVKYAGQKARRMYFIASSAGTMATGLVMMSFDKRLQVNLTADAYHIEDVDGFMEILNDEIKKCKIHYDPEQEGYD